MKRAPTEKCLTFMKQYSLTDLKFITPTTLRAWFDKGSPSGKGKFAIVDVRDSDYIGGHIKGCYHYPAGNFHTSLPQLQQKLIENEIDDVVFHCALSQVRGPRSTLMFLRSLNEVQDPNDRAFFDKLSVSVLQGGFTSWQQKYGSDTEVTEDYIKDLWE